LKNLFSIGLVSIAFTICSHATAQEAPVIVNPETGAIVNLTRAYWDANVDIANKNMQCDYFSFSTETAVFEQSDRDYSGWPISNLSQFYIFNVLYSHRPLPNAEIQRNRAFVVTPNGRNLDRHKELPFWSVTDGRYSGFAPLSASEFVEIVSVNAPTDNAVRIWFRDQPALSFPNDAPNPFPSYSVCYDLPTGTAGSGNTQLVDLPDFTIDSEEVVGSIPEIINRATGETVDIVRGRWSYNNSIAGRVFSCEFQMWYDEFGRYDRVTGRSFNTAYYLYNGGDFIDVSFRNNDFESYYFPFELNRPSTFISPGGRYMELTEDGYHMWDDSDGFDDCTVVDFAPSEFLPLIAVENTPVVADITAPLVITENCDYTDADNFDGYGFDPVTMLSCPPLASDNSVDETTDNVQDTGTTDSADVVQTNPTPVDNAPDDSTVSSNDETSVQNTNDVQTNTDTTDNVSDDSTGNSNDATTAENENTAVADEVVATNTQTDSTGTDLVSSDETRSPSSGGGSFWLPILMFAVAFRRPLRVRANRTYLIMTYTIITNNKNS